MEASTPETPRPTPTSRSRGRTISLVASALVALAIATLVFITRPFTGAELTDVDIAQAYLEARSTHDLDQARQLVSDDFRSSEWPTGIVEIETIEMLFGADQAYELVISDIECSQEGNLPDWVAVECTFLLANALHRAANHPPTQQEFRFAIEDGQITRIFTRALNGPDIWNSWITFLADGHPQFLDLAHGGVGARNPDTARRLADQLPRYLDLYSEWLDSGQ